MRLASAIGPLQAVLPPVPGSAGAGHIDMSRLTDAEIDQIEAMRSTADALRLKAGAAPPPPPEGDRAVVNDLLGRIDRLLEQVAVAETRADAAEEGERCAVRLRDQAVDRAHEFERRALEAEAASWRAAHPDQHGPQQNNAPATSPPTAARPSNGDRAARGNVTPIRPDVDTSPWAGLALASDLGASGPPGVLFDASDPSGRRSGKP
jgi:hypothetical protein